MKLVSKYSITVPIDNGSNGVILKMVLDLIRLTSTNKIHNFYGDTAMHDAMNSYGFYVVFTPFVVVALIMLFSGSGSK